MTMRMQINSPVLWAQEQEAKARRARLNGVSQRKALAPEVEDEGRSTFLEISLHLQNDAHVQTFRLYNELCKASVGDRVLISDIINETCVFYKISRNNLLSQRRAAHVVKPRQIAIYLAKVLTLRSLPEIGRRFGGRDHTTVLHAVRKIDGLLQNDAQLSAEIEALKRKIEGGSNAGA